MVAYTRHQVPADLRAEVESLLRFEDEAVDPLHGYVASAAERVLLSHELGTTAGRALPDGEASGEHCGLYQLLDLIRRCGMERCTWLSAQMAK
jgi:hypothetical protein